MTLSSRSRAASSRMVHRSQRRLARRSIAQSSRLPTGRSSTTSRSQAGTLGALYAEALSNFGGCTGDGGGGTLVGQTAATNIYHLTHGRWADDPDRNDVVVSHAAASPGRVATDAAIRAAADAVGGERSPIYRAQPRPIPARSAAVASER